MKEKKTHTAYANKTDNFQPNNKKKSLISFNPFSSHKWMCERADLLLFHSAIEHVQMEFN